MSNIKQNIKEIIREINEASDLFYQQKSQLGYQKLNIIVERLMELENVLTYINKENSTKKIDSEALMISLKEALKAMEEKDTVLIADVFKYDVIESLEYIEKNL